VANQKERAERLWRRAKLPGRLQNAHPLAFVDRHGTLHLPYKTALRFAQAFAAAEPEAVLTYLNDLETEYRAGGYEPGNRIDHQLLRQLSPSNALVREWAGHASEVGLLREEIDWLHGLVRQAIYEFERVGAKDAARRFERALEGMAHLIRARPWRVTLRRMSPRGRTRRH
jgi:hypothetical protein